MENFIFCAVSLALVVFEDYVNNKTEYIAIYISTHLSVNIFVQNVFFKKYKVLLVSEKYIFQVKHYRKNFTISTEEKSKIGGLD